MSASQREKPTTKAPAIDRAARLWKEAALYVREQLRADGVTGDLPYLNDTVSGKRGKAAPHQIKTLASKMAASGLPEATAIAALSHTTSDIVRLAYAEYRSEGSAA